jgi:hypothetical protein
VAREQNTAIIVKLMACPVFWLAVLCIVVRVTLADSNTVLLVFY